MTVMVSGNHVVVMPGGTEIKHSSVELLSGKKSHGLEAGDEDAIQ
jgi:hypothetical protein